MDFPALFSNDVSMCVGMKVVYAVFVSMLLCRLLA